MLAVAAVVLACAPTVTGATPAERAAIGRMVCLIPHSAIREVQVVAPPTDMKGPSNAIGIRILLGGWNGAGTLETTRIRWEGEMAAGAIADGFRRLGLRRVYAYAVDPVGRPATQLVRRDEPVRDLQPRVFEVTANGPIGLPRTLGEGVGRWRDLEAKLDGLDRRFHVRSHLDRVNPFGKAPAVTVVVDDPVAFLGGAPLAAFLKALRWNEARYDGVYLGVRWREKLVWAATVTVRAGGGSSCGAAIAPGDGRLDAVNHACALTGNAFD